MSLTVVSLQMNAILLGVGASSVCINAIALLYDYALVAAAVVIIQFDCISSHVICDRQTLCRFHDISDMSVQCVAIQQKVSDS